MKTFVKDYLDLANANIKFVVDHPIGTAVSVVVGFAITMAPIAVDVIKLNKLNKRIKKVKVDLKNEEA